MLEALLQTLGAHGQVPARRPKLATATCSTATSCWCRASTPNSLALKLIDYDGMWVPALAKSKSGEVGHANYQHPRRLREGTYSLEVDRFPLLLVATALRALKAGKSLWDKYDNGDNLLFKESDLAAPGQSALFEELASLPDAGLVMLAAQVRAALKGPLESTALLEDAMPDARPTPSLMSKRPSRLAPGSAAVAKQKTSPAASAVDTAPAKRARDFDRLPTSGAGSPRTIPLVAWVGGALALVVVAGAIGSVTLWAMGRKAPPPEINIVQNNVVSPTAREPKAATEVTPPVKVERPDNALMIHPSSRLRSS